MQITATIHRNFRDSESMYPKVLLTDISGFDRDHCWVDADMVKSAIPRTNSTKLRIKFTATIKNYYSNKQTIATVENLRIIGKA